MEIVKTSSASSRRFFDFGNKRQGVRFCRKKKEVNISPALGSRPTVF
jgi:hypothetical protein